MILVKHAPSFHVAWLYRILYCKQLDDFLYDHGVFAMLDYDLNATVYATGNIITIEVNFYTDEGRAIEGDIRNLRIDTSTTTIGLAGSQIIAETKKPLAGPDIEKVAQALLEIDSQPWQDGDDIDTIDTRTIHTNTELLTFGKEPVPGGDSLTVSISLPLSQRLSQASPLFSYLADCIHANCRKSIENTYGIHNKGAQKTRHAPKDIIMPAAFELSPAAREIMNNDLAWNILQDIASVYDDCIQDFHKEAVVKRFVDRLHHFSYDSDLPSPDLGSVLNDSHVFVGAKGWQRLGTRQNIHLLLDAMLIHVQYGDLEHTLPTAQLPKAGY